LRRLPKRVDISFCIEYRVLCTSSIVKGLPVSSAAVPALSAAAAAEPPPPPDSGFITEVG